LNKSNIASNFFVSSTERTKDDLVTRESRFEVFVFEELVVEGDDDIERRIGVTMVEQSPECVVVSRRSPSRLVGDVASNSFLD
jgi:hypothetical protein